MKKPSDDLPAKLQARYQEIIDLLDAVCDRCLNAEYKDLCRLLAERACRAGLPLDRGKPDGWAAGIASAIGWVNFLGDPSQTPHMTTAELAGQFGVSQGTMSAKSKAIREGLDLMPAHPAWTVTSRLADNPLVWMVQLEGGVIADVRHLPREAQEAAFRKGLIPFLPGEPPAAGQAGPQADSLRDDPSDEEDAADANEEEDELDEDDMDDETYERTRPERERNWRELNQRIKAVVPAGAETNEEIVEAFLRHLKANLQLPCDVKGAEDFDWEEPYVFGGWDEDEYELLKQSQPSYTDRFQLLDISNDGPSEWMLFPGEDITAHVRRKSDGKKFRLGLSELAAVDKTSRNYQLIDDFAVWLVNNR